jgi:prevent-host-death family protein
MVTLFGYRFNQRTRGQDGHNVYNETMDVSIADAKNRLTQLIRAVEEGEQVVITRNGQPVAQIVPPPEGRRQVRMGGMKDRIRLLPGWDAPVDYDRFLEGDL